MNVVDATASGAFEFIAGTSCSKAAGIPACGSPLPPGIANVEHHLVKFFFICLSGQEFLKALCTVGVSTLKYAWDEFCLVVTVVSEADGTARPLGGGRRVTQRHCHDQRYTETATL